MQRIDDFYIAANAIVLGDVVLSAGANIWYGCVVRGDLARITFGPRANLQDGCIVHTDHDEPQLIEEGVVVGHGAMLHGRLIGKDTLVGMGAYHTVFSLVTPNMAGGCGEGATPLTVG